VVSEVRRTRYSVSLQGFQAGFGWGERFRPLLALMGFSRLTKLSRPT
jgi:hypothetical protein